MSELKFNSQICTTKEQSQRLLNLGLKPETSDMYITNMSNKGINYTDDYQIGSISFERVMSFWKEKGLKLENTAWEIIPSWSLHRLIEMLEIYLDYRPFTGFNDMGNVSLYDDIIDLVEDRIIKKLFSKKYLKQ